MTGSVSEDLQSTHQTPTDWRLLPLTLGLYSVCLFSAVATESILATLWPLCAGASLVLALLVLRVHVSGPRTSGTLPKTKAVALHAGLLLIFMVPVFWAQGTAKSHWAEAQLGSEHQEHHVFKAHWVLVQPLQKRINQFGATSYQAPAEITGIERSDGQLQTVKTPWPVWLSADRPHAAAAGSTIRGVVKVDPAGDFSRIQAYAKVQGPMETIVEAPATVFTELRERLQETADRHATGLAGLDASSQQQRGRALIASMIVGDTSGHDEQLRQDMKTAGLSHLSAVSGANCALVFGVVTAILRRVGLPRWCQVSGSLTALAFFVLVVGPEPSVLRAAVMGVVGAVAVFFGRGRKTMPLLFIACILLLTLDPWYATDLAFQLSVAATWGIVGWGKTIADALSRWMPRGIAQALAIAIAAQFATIPVLGPATGSIPTHSVAANLIVTPLVPAVTLLGTASLPFLLWFPELAELLLYPVGWLTMAVGIIGRQSAALPHALLPWPEGLPGYLLGSAVLLVFGVVNHVISKGIKKGRLLMPRIVRYGSLVGWFRFHYHGNHRPWWLVLCVVAALLATGWLLRPQSIPRDWSLVACDVGQGDMFVLNSGDGRAVVIDAGPEPSAAQRCLDRLRIHTVERMFISHQHADHYAGMNGVLAGRRVETITFGSAQQQVIFPTGGVTAEPAHPGQLWQFPSGGSAEHSIEILALAARRDRGASENDASAVLQVTLKPTQTVLLFTGDLEEHAFASLDRERRLPGRVHLLKVAHHGARNGGEQAFARLQPDIALVSVGKDNDYGHPHPDILAAIDAAGARLLRTDELGSIWIRFSKDSFATGQF